MASNEEQQKKGVCSKRRAAVGTLIAVVSVVCLLSSNLLHFNWKHDVKTTAIPLTLPILSGKKKSPQSMHVYNSRLLHHYIGHGDLTPDSLVLPAEEYTQNQTYNFRGTDTLVVVHIQKTGCSDFLRHLVTVRKDGEYLCQLPDHLLKLVERRQALPKGKKDRVSCLLDPSKPNGPQWLISEKTMGWKCGVHPTLTEFKKCLPSINRGNKDLDIRNHFMTYLRHPVMRYLSEFEHVVRGAHWSARKQCGGKKVTDEEMPPCYPGFYHGRVWNNLTLMSFMNCRSNWAVNRQVMSLADLPTAGCYNRSYKGRSSILLESAKSNLRKLAFFGLTEYQTENCLLFEKVFNVTFAAHLETREMASLNTAPFLQEIWNRTDLYNKIAQINSLDMQLYEYALKVFALRAKAIGLTIDMQKVDHEIRNIAKENINLNGMKYLRGNFDLPNKD